VSHNDLLIMISSLVTGFNRRSTAPVGVLIRARSDRWDGLG
jgi:hypothetical protein